jgi:N-acyl-D-aspartate/D-glutamate deacylase
MQRVRRIRYWIVPAWFAAAGSWWPLQVRAQQQPQVYDVVIANGRVIDPETRLDAVRHIGIVENKIRAVSETPLRGRQILDATGMVVAPGFIDLHAHGQTPENYRVQALDGVTTALELEVGTEDVDRWYAEREGKALINYGVSIGHIRVRMQVMGDPGAMLPSGPAANRVATPEEIERMKELLERGLRRGAVAVGFGITYTPAATRWEILEMFRVAAKYGASAHIHIRGGADSLIGFEEAIAAAAITGAPVHIVHLNSVSTSATPKTLQIVAEAQARKLDVTAEAYPYTAGMTEIQSALFDGWENQPDEYFGRLQWVETGERLTRETFRRYRSRGGMVILHNNTEEMVKLAVASPITMIASDGHLENGKGHPRTAGTYSRVLGRYVREQQALPLMTALSKMSYLPAKRLEFRVPAMRDKGRIRPNADADIVVFDPNTIIDRATYQNPALPSVGMKYVLVNGVPVVRDGRLDESQLPGRPVRALISQP